MGAYAGKVRKTAVDNATIRLNASGEISAGGIMEPFSAGTKGGAPSVFYVDGNVVSSGNGLGWLSAVKTLAEGLAMAHAYQSTSGNRAWAHRAIVYCCGDVLTEDLVILAEKSDIIGVGSSSGFTKCSLDGVHVPVTTNVWGSRWYNMDFRSTSSGILWTLTAVSGGIEFHNCIFQSRGAVHTIAIKATAVGFMTIQNCVWAAAPAGFSTTAIDILAGNAADTIIRDNIIVGTIGIRVDSSATASAGNIIVDNNTIKAATLCIDDNANIVVYTNNMLISAADNATLSNCMDTDQALGAGNILTGSTDTQSEPFVTHA